MTLNIALTVALAFAIGPLGVVLGTLGACWISAPLFFLALHRQVAGAASGLVRVWGRAGCVAAAIAVPLWFVERAAAHAMPRLPALAACGALSIACALLYGALLAPHDIAWLLRYAVHRGGVVAPSASHQRTIEDQTGFVLHPGENDA
jgi:peptidoglycan biosynthesis protein MviN/MurJ (putative lipid II flippase)